MPPPPPLPQCSYTEKVMEAAVEIVEALSLSFNNNDGQATDTRRRIRSQESSEIQLVETKPAIAAGISVSSSSPFDLVETMHFLYVCVLQGVALHGYRYPYVRLRIGDFRASTADSADGRDPVWRSLFAFPKNNLRPNSVLVVTVEDSEDDDALGSVWLRVDDFPIRSPTGRPVSPLSYSLRGPPWRPLKRKGEIVLAVWFGTQADAAFAESWHVDGGLQPSRSAVNYSPRLCYLRVRVVEARDLVLSDKSRGSDIFVKIRLGGVRGHTATCPSISVNPIWNEDVFLVVAEPVDGQQLIISVVDKAGPQFDDEDFLGNVIFPLSSTNYHGNGIDKPLEAGWFDLCKPFLADGNINGLKKKRRARIVGKIHFAVYLNTVDPVLYEPIHSVSDIQPMSKQVQRRSIGVLELGILDARGLIRPKTGVPCSSCCVAKYGSKWVSTRTVHDTSSPRWNEQFAWEVFDPCTVITIAVFNNFSVDTTKKIADGRFGKIRIRLSTLQFNCVYTHYYPLLVLQTSGLIKTGELHLAIRFTRTATWFNTTVLYGKPLFLHTYFFRRFLQSKVHDLRYQGVQAVATSLGKALPSLDQNVVEYMLDVDSHQLRLLKSDFGMHSIQWSRRKSKVNTHRLTSILTSIASIAQWLDGVRNWSNPGATILVHALFLILVSHPGLILPAVFFSLFTVGLWNYQFRPRHPPHIATNLSHVELVNTDDLDEELDTFPTSRPFDMVSARYDRLRLEMGLWQKVVGELATQGERLQAVVSWRDHRATMIFMTLMLVCAVAFYLRFKMVVMLAGLYLLRHPVFRTQMPSVACNFISRSPPGNDVLL